LTTIRIAHPEYIRKGNFIPANKLGVTSEVILNSINHCYQTLDIINKNLVINHTPPLSKLVELANLSSIVGNLLGEGFARNSNGFYIRNKPHTYPDLLSTNPSNNGIEIKMALETKSPKGHLAKDGYYLTYRYVLTDANEKYTKGLAYRGDTVTIWEVKLDYLNKSNFSESNTEGDSGKTATILPKHHNKMKLLYFNPKCVPYRHSEKKSYVGFN
jgi:hypothetical protein